MKENETGIAAVVWPWRRERVAKEKSSWKAVLLQCLVITCMGAIFFYWERKIAAFFLLGVAGVIFFCGLFLPPVYQRLERLGKRLGHLVGRMLTSILLRSFFYLFFWPCSLLVRKSNGREGAWRGQNSSYWIARAADTTAAEQYKRQF